MINAIVLLVLPYRVGGRFVDGKKEGELDDLCHVICIGRIDYPRNGQKNEGGRTICHVYYQGRIDDSCHGGKK